MGIQIEQEEVKLSLFVDDMFHIQKTLKILTKNLIEQVNKFSEVGEC